MDIKKDPLDPETDRYELLHFSDDFDFGPPQWSDDDDSDSEDDIYQKRRYCDDESDSEEESSTDNEKERQKTSNPTNTMFQWQKVDTKDEKDKSLVDFDFSVKTPKNSQNIDKDTCRKPIDFFSLFFDAELIKTIVFNTNKYAKHFLSLKSTVEWMQAHPNNIFSQWPENGVTVVEVKKYFGLWLTMCYLVGKTDIKRYWTTKPLLRIPFFSSTMDYNLFFLIHQMVHVNDVTTEVKRGQNGFDMWCKIKAFVEQVNRSSKKFFVPGKNISIIESLIERDRSGVSIEIQPRKRGRQFGVKRFQVCDMSGYVLHTQLYCGRDLDFKKDQEQAQAIVIKLLEDCNLLNKGHHIYTDDFHTKPQLAHFLLEQETLLTGEVQMKTKELPYLKSANPKTGEGKFWRCGKILCLAFRETETQMTPKFILSTGHNAVFEEKVTRKGKSKKKKPSAVFDYDLCMRGGLNANHLRDRCVRRYWRMVFQYLLDVCVLNSFMIYQLTVPQEKKLKTREDYVSSVVKSLCGRETTQTESDSSDDEDEFEESSSDSDCPWSEDDNDFGDDDKFMIV